MNSVEKVWIVRLRGQADPVLYWTREEVLSDESVAYDLECAGWEIEEDSYLEWHVGEDHMYVDDGFDARLVELPPRKA